MLYLELFITLVLLTITQFLLIISIRNPQKINKMLEIKSKTRLPVYIFSISTIFFFCLLYVFLKQLSSPQPRDTSYLVTINNAINSTKTLQQLRVETYSNTQSLFYLYTAPDTSEMTLKQLVFDIKKKACVKPCTINLYDNKEAYLLDQQRKSIVDSNQMTQWNLKNYVFVADHYLGYLSNDQYPTFSFYPYQDWYYRELLKKKNK